MAKAEVRAVVYARYSSDNQREESIEERSILANTYSIKVQRNENKGNKQLTRHFFYNRRKNKTVPFKRQRSVGSG
ncbi:hypothetical protein VTU32_10375 [Thermoanaerobacter sp. CM-CNRG TB177]|jgi:hypothetical protein|uniref:hypothetical protein n=1 Tax=Thermoanaerobacter TaxID=1754 RepID=UPI001BDED2B3|nr:MULTISPECIES: hypothetical protein [Thermoanaerobacter]MBT1279775.1 hypothetical protein [Thermoanaerobacter sp. CM-CNRG TB177]